VAVTVEKYILHKAALLAEFSSEFVHNASVVEVTFQLLEGVAPEEGLTALTATVQDYLLSDFFTSNKSDFE
jgi:hypothetical protein